MVLQNGTIYYIMEVYANQFRRYAKIDSYFKNNLNDKDLYLSNEATIQKQFNQNLNLVRQTSLFNQSYRMSKISNPEDDNLKKLLILLIFVK